MAQPRGWMRWVRDHGIWEHSLLDPRRLSTAFFLSTRLACAVPAGRQQRRRLMRLQVWRVRCVHCSKRCLNCMLKHTHGSSALADRSRCLFHV
jgi:hypothetical protein